MKTHAPLLHPLSSLGGERARHARSTPPSADGRSAWSRRIGSVAGIGVDVHVTFALLLVWTALGALGAGGGLAAVAAALALNLAVFASVVLHELGHVLVARRYGIRTRHITLWPIGGVAHLERIPDDPRQELVVALAGPVVSSLVAIAVGGASWLAGAALGREAIRPVGGAWLPTLALVNVSLALFNLLPAFPMDGGRALRASLARRLDRARATTLAVRIAQGIAIAIAAAGLMLEPLLVFVALFVWMGARRESDTTLPPESRA